jgi:hypothetical protein
MIWYLPAGTSLNWNAPFSSVNTDFFSSAIVTTALRAAVPEGSILTIPRTVPVELWAIPVTDKRRAIRVVERIV